MVPRLFSMPKTLWISVWWLVVRVEAGLFDAVLHVVGHGLWRDLEDGRLVHVVPEAGYAVGDEVFVEGAPPVARLDFWVKSGKTALPGQTTPT
jgi:hypothetical protein